MNSITTTLVRMWVVLAMIAIPMVALGYDCIDGELTTTMTLSGGTHTLTRCRIHSGGSIVLNGGGTLSVTESNLVAEDGGERLITINPTTEALLFSLHSSNMTSASSDTTVHIGGLPVDGSQVSIVGNYFGHMSDVVFSDTTVLSPLTSVVFESNVVENHFIGVGATDTDNGFALIFAYIVMSGGSLRVAMNTGASLTGSVPSGYAGDQYKLLEIKSTGFTAAEAGTVVVSGNTGFYPLITMELGITTVAHAHTTIVVSQNSVVQGDTPVTFYVYFGSSPDDVPRNIDLLIADNNVTHILGGQWEEVVSCEWDASTYAVDDTVSIVIRNNTFLARDSPTGVSMGFDMEFIMFFLDADDIPASPTIRIMQNSLDVESSFLGDGTVFMVLLKCEVYRDASTLVSSNAVRIAGGLYFAGLFGGVSLVLNNTSITVSNNEVSIGGANNGALTACITSIEFSNASSFALVENTLVLSDISNLVSTTAFIMVGGVLEVLDETDNLINVSNNIISGDCPSTYDVFLSSSSLTGYANVTRGVGCDNTVCGAHIRNLVNTTSGDGLVWDFCPATTTAAMSMSVTRTIDVPVESKVPITKAPITTYPDDPSSPTALTATGMVGATLGSAASSVDSASSVQVMAMLSVMACRTDGEDEGTARLFLTPLRIDDSLAAADLIGSIVLCVGLSGLYFIVSACVLAIARRTGPKAGDEIADEEGTCYDEDGALRVREMRAFRAKLFLLYPRLPLLILTLLFPGIVFSSCSLLYGVLSETASVGERVLGGLCLAASVAFCVYHVVAGNYAIRRVEEQDEIESVDAPSEVKDTCSPPVDDEAYSSPENCSPPTTPTKRHLFGFTPKEEANDEDNTSGAEETPIEAVVADEDKDNVDPSTDPDSRLWFIRYTDTDRGHHPRILEALLLPDGRWNSVASRGWCTVVTSLKAASWGAGRCTAHGLIRMLLISIVAAVNAKTAAGCDAVQALIALVSFLHGISVLAFRFYGIPALNPLQGLQSILIGLLACASFIDDDTTQSVFSTTLLVLVILTTVLSVLAALLEIRVQRLSSQSK